MASVAAVGSSYLHLLVVSMSAAIAISGLGVLFLGKWNAMKLKFLAVSFVTISAVWFLFYYYMFYDVLACRTVEDMCKMTDSYLLLRNIAILLFNIAIGRDAIVYGKRDRRKNVNA